MIELIRQFLWDPTAARRWIRGVLLFGASLGGLYAVNGVLTWPIVLGALTSLIAGMIGVGEPNQKPPGP